MQRVVDPPVSALVSADRREMEVNEPAALRAASSVTDECRRLAELLRLDVVGVATTAQGRRRVVLWTEPNGPALPARLDDVLEGRAAGWIVAPLAGDDAVFGRMTETSNVRAAEVLRAVGPSLAAGAASGTVAPDDLPTLLEAAADAGSGAPAEVTLADRARVAEIMEAIRDQTGFDTVSLFDARRGAVWRLIHRVGPDRGWHAVLDPRVAGTATTDVLFSDAAFIPGTGERLAAMGCGAVGVLVLPDGARLVLDSATRRTPDDGWRGLAREDVARLGAALAGAGTAGVTARTESELDVIERVTDSVRRSLEDPATDAARLLGAVAEALGADELRHLVDRAGEIDILSNPASEWPRRFPREVRAALATLPDEGPLDEATARQLGVVLGLSSPRLSAAFAGDSQPREALVAGWRTGPGLSARTMRTVARLVGAARTVVDARRHAVDSLMVRERNRWASEIHDGLTQLVTTAVLELETMGKRIERDPQEAIETLASTKAAIRTSLSELRGLIFDLSREGGSGGGSLEPLEKYVNDVVERWRLPARVTVEGDLPDVPRPVLAAAYVVIRESLANAAKHASPTSVNVNVRTTSDEVIVEVGDTGRGFSAIDAPSRARTRGHFGLDMMSRRVAEVGGSLDVQSTPGQGTRVVARLPVRGGQR